MNKKSPGHLAQLKSILQLPFIVLVVIPVLINYFFNDFRFKPAIDEYVRFFVAILFFFLGIALFIQSIILFIKIGSGTLAPWNPTKKLVVRSLYRYTRNPMILGVFFILLSESFFSNSMAIFIWALLFICINHIYFLFKEEPDLAKRFGNEYLEYKKNVPRWFPRFKPWNQSH